MALGPIVLVSFLTSVAALQRRVHSNWCLLGLCVSSEEDIQRKAAERAIEQEYSQAKYCSCNFKCGKPDASTCYQACCPNGPDPELEKEAQCKCGFQCFKNDGSFCFTQCCPSGGIEEEVSHAATNQDLQAATIGTLPYQKPEESIGDKVQGIYESVRNRLAGSSDPYKEGNQIVKEFKPQVVDILGKAKRDGNVKNEVMDVLKGIVGQEMMPGTHGIKEAFENEERKREERREERRQRKAAKAAEQAQQDAAADASSIPGSSWTSWLR